ncbi:hypothetical protein KKA53_05255 [Candidatus Dependentiae bacterium]|nr:hypothetical protein [Candidatus Dependentiae bacterium]
MSGVSADTPALIVVDGGELAYGGTDIGALIGSVKFTLEREYYTPEFIRVRGPVKGTRFVIKEIPRLTCMMSEWQVARIQYALPDTDLSSDASSDVLTSVPGRLPDASYEDIVYKTTLADGKEMQITVRDAVCDANLEVEFPDTEAAQYEVTFVGHYDPADATVAPWEIMIETA